MNLPLALGPGFIALLLGLATAGAVATGILIRGRWSTDGLPSRGLPWTLRCCWWPAGAVALVLQRWLPRPWLTRAQRDLARCDLESQLPAARWYALRCCHALLLAGAGLALAQTLQGSAVIYCLIGLTLGWLAAPRWLHRLRVERELSVGKQLPAYLDVLTLLVEAGATLTSSLRMAIDKAPEGPLRQIFERVLREIRSGRTRLEALEHVAGVYQIDGLSALVTALLQSEASGVSLGTLLRAQSEQRSAERHIRAEKLALQAPVKMLAPLVLCIFPCTFVVISVPVIARLLDAVQS